VYGQALSFWTHLRHRTRANSFSLIISSYNGFLLSCFPNPNSHLVVSRSVTSLREGGFRVDKGPSPRFFFPAFFNSSPRLFAQMRRPPARKRFCLPEPPSFRCLFEELARPALRASWRSSANPAAPSLRPGGLWLQGRAPGRFSSVHIQATRLLYNLGRFVAARPSSIPPISFEECAGFPSSPHYDIPAVDEPRERFECGLSPWTSWYFFFPYHFPDLRRASPEN